MDKQEFIERVIRLSEYNNSLNQLEDILGIGCENFISDMINDMGDTLIKAVNPNLEGLTEDYFYETFWNNIGEVDGDDWGTFYDLLVEGAADPEYIKRYKGEYVCQM